MKNGVTVWHYRNRTVLENAEFFAAHGFDSVSLHGASMHKIAADPVEGEQLAEIVKRTGLVLAAHHKLPLDHSENTVEAFKKAIDDIGKWQDKHGCLGILSFDVAQDIRDNITPYIDYVMENVKGAKIALEDFGLNADELATAQGALENNPAAQAVGAGFMQAVNRTMDNKFYNSNELATALRDFAAVLAQM